MVTARKAAPEVSRCRRDLETAHPGFLVRTMAFILV